MIGVLARPRLPRGWRRRLARYRRPLVAGLLTLAAVSAVQAAVAPARAGASVLVAARDLPIGHLLTRADLLVLRWPTPTPPAGALEHPEGGVLASPLREGEPVTDARLAGRGLLTGQPPGTVAVPVRLADPATATLLQPGDRVDVLAAPVPLGDPATGGTPGRALRLARGALLLAVGTGGRAEGSGGLLDEARGPGAGTSEPAGGTGAGSARTGATWTGSTWGDPVSGTARGLLVLAVDRDLAARVAAGAGNGVSVALTGG